MLILFVRFSGTDTRPEEVHHMYTIMKSGPQPLVKPSICKPALFPKIGCVSRSQNEQQRADVDQIFLEKRSHEEEIGRPQLRVRETLRGAFLVNS